MKMLGDILAENFQIKAQIIRLRYGIACLYLYMFFLVVAFSARFVITFWILKKLSAPTFVWVMLFISIPLCLIVEQIEARSKDQKQVRPSIRRHP